MPVFMFFFSCEIRDRKVFLLLILFLVVYILPVASWIRSKSSQSKCRGTCTYTLSKDKSYTPYLAKIKIRATETSSLLDSSGFETSEAATDQVDPAPKAVIFFVSKQIILEEPHSPSAERETRLPNQSKVVWQGIAKLVST